MKPRSRKLITRVLVFLLLGMIVNIAAGCAAQHADPQLLLDLQPGITRDQVHDRLNLTGKHQFAATLDDSHVAGERFDFYPGTAVYVIYRKGHFDKYVVPPPIPERLVPAEPSGWRSARMPLVSEARMQQVLQLPAMSEGDVHALTGQVHAAKTRRELGMEPLNVWPASVAVVAISPALAPLSVVGSAFQSTSDVRPWKVRLEMTAEEVDRALGRPLRTSADGALRVYGKKSEWKRDDDVQDTLVAVEFQDNRAVRVYSHDFFNHGLKDESR